MKEMLCVEVPVSRIATDLVSSFGLVFYQLSDISVRKHVFFMYLCIALDISHLRRTQISLFLS